MSEQADKLLELLKKATDPSTPKEEIEALMAEMSKGAADGLIKCALKDVEAIKTDPAKARSACLMVSMAIGATRDTFDEKRKAQHMAALVDIAMAGLTQMVPLNKLTELLSPKYLADEMSEFAKERGL